MSKHRENDKIRADRKKLFNFHYERVATTNRKCFYCEAPETCQDHFPPLSKIENINIALFKELGGQLLMIPSCRECNARLSCIMHYTLIERVAWLHDKFVELANKFDSMWEKQELSELGYTLRTYVETAVNKRGYYQGKADAVYRRLSELYFDETGMVAGFTKKKQ